MQLVKIYVKAIKGNIPVEVYFITHVRFEGEQSNKFRWDIVRGTTIPKAEVVAVIDEIEILPDGCDIHVFSNSKFMEVLNRFYRNPTELQDYLSNLCWLYEYLINMLNERKHEFQFTWVAKGENSVIDYMANKLAQIQQANRQGR